MPRLLIAFAFSLTLLLTASGATVAHDEDCPSRVLSAPVEAVELPRGWEWNRLSAEAAGIWSGSLIADSWRSRPPSVGSFFLGCAPDAAGWFDAAVRAEQVVSDVARVAAVPVGEESVAVRRPTQFRGPEAVYLRWYRGPVVALMIAGPDQDWTEVEAFALALDELIAAALD